jgi:hypothetical protein
MSSTNPVSKSNAQKVAWHIMKHTGCHEISILELSAKHRKMLEEKKPHKKSRLPVCIPIDNSSRRKSLVRIPRHENPRPSDAFLRVPSFDYDSEDGDLLKPRRRTVRLSELKIKPVDLPLPTEDDELMGDDKKDDTNNFAVAGRFEINDGHLHLTSDRFLIPKKRRQVVKTTITPDPNAKVIPFSSNEVVFYQDDCDCHFCDMLRHYDGCPLLFARKFISDKGHGFFPKI